MDGGKCRAMMGEEHSSNAIAGDDRFRTRSLIASRRREPGGGRVAERPSECSRGQGGPNACLIKDLRFAPNN